MNKSTIFIIFGSTGDLTKRMLIPALYTLFESKEIINNQIICIGRKPFSNKEYQNYLLKNSYEFLDHKNKKLFEKFLKNISYQLVDVDTLADYKRLKQEISKLNIENPQVIYYLSTPPSLFPVILNNIKKSGLNEFECRIAFEKPFGTDLKSATKLNDKVMEVFEENQVYRIDHYLGKEAIQNIIAFRFANRIFEPIWNNHFIDNIQITVSEKLGVETRGAYYDQSGALRDMLQNHLLQVLSLIAMEAPHNLESNTIHNKKVNVLNAIKIDKNITNNIIFGQYEGYKNEIGVNKNSKTETFVAMKLCIDNRRFEGVPIYLRTGKYMKNKQTRVVIEFKKTPSILFNHNNDVESNKIIIDVAPNEGISLMFNVKEVGHNKIVKPIYSHFENKIKGFGAYHKLIKDLILGDSTLYSRWDMIKRSWEIVDPIIHCKKNCPIIYKYKPGKYGPTQSDDLLKRDGKKWFN